MREPSPDAPTLLIAPGPLAWTFPAGLGLLFISIISIAMIVLLYPRMTVPACEMQLRLQLTFALPAAIGGFLLPAAVGSGSPALRWAAGVLLGAIIGGGAWLAIASVFPRFC